MNISIKSVGRYFVRHKRMASEFRDLAGKILKFIEVKDGALVFHIMNGWEQTGQNISLPLEYAADNGWHDVSNLICSISGFIPEDSTVSEFANEVAKTMRNYLTDLESYRLNRAELEGRTAFRGIQKDNVVELNPVPYHVAEFDSDGFGVAFYGDTGDLWSDKVPVVKIIRADSPSWQWYDAKAVTAACNQKVSQFKSIASEKLLSSKKAMEMDDEVPRNMCQRSTRSAFANKMILGGN